MNSVAIDAMGGDFGAKPIVNGVLQALSEKNFKAFLVGDEKEISPLIPDDKKKDIEIINSSEIFPMKEEATNVIKRKNTSIYKAIELVKNKRCKAVVSAGHSGATMTLATLKLGRVKGTLRPSIATFMPTIKNFPAILLDAGANTDCKPEYLFQFGIMGQVYAKHILKVKNPKIAIISNGEEDCKGDELTKQSFNLLKKLENFCGNIEGNHIFDGNIDVIVSDGFIGNIILKTSEGVASTMGNLIKNEINKSLLNKVGALLMQKVFKNVKKITDYAEYGGAPLLGVNDCVIISHGKSNSKAIKNAIFQALNILDTDLNKKLEDELLKYKI